MGEFRDATALHRNNRWPVVHTCKEAICEDCDHLLVTTMMWVEVE
jgi:hypothetical protein